MFKAFGLEMSEENKDSQFTRFIMQLQPGQEIILPRETALKLINMGRVVPITKVAFRIFSEALGDHLWIITDENEAEVLRTSGVLEAIYTEDEIRKLRGMPKAMLKTVHKAKTIFPSSTVKKAKGAEDTASPTLSQNPERDEILTHGEHTKPEYCEPCGQEPWPDSCGRYSMKYHLVTRKLEAWCQLNKKWCWQVGQRSP